MADCEATLRELFVFLDGELTSEEQDDIVAHLNTCTDCQGAFEFHLELKTAVAEKCRNDDMPPSLMAKIENCFGDAFGSPFQNP